MSFALLVVGIALVATPRWLQTRLGVLPAAESTRVAALALTSGVIVVEAGLLMLALPTVLRAAGIPEVAHLCEEVLVHVTPGGPAIGWMAAVLAVGIPATALHAASRAHVGARALHVDPWLGQHEDKGSYELVTVPTSRVMALCVPGPRPQIVVSSGLVELLDTNELDAVVGHEIAHHQLRHHRLLALAVVVERVFFLVPGARRSAHVLREEVERSADEKAATRSQGPLPVSAALRAIARCSAVHDKPESGSVANRLRGLRRHGSSRIRSARMLTYAPMSALGIVGLAVATAWVTDAHHLLALGGHCFS